MSDIVIDCVSEKYRSNEKHGLDFKFNLSLNTAKNQTPTKPDQGIEAEDLLRIKFNHSKAVPEDVKEYIANNLGVFDLTENGSEKIFVFELKINDINIELIRTVFEKFFAPAASNANLSLTYSRNQTPEEWISDLKNHSDVPFMLHIIENSQLKLEGNEVIEIMGALLKYAKSENQALVQPWMNLLFTLASFKLKGVVNSYQKMPKDAFKEMEFEQKDNIKEFFYLFDNPINNYIFEANQPGNLQIQGRILNILNYDFHASFPNMQEFIEQVMNL